MAQDLASYLDLLERGESTQVAYELAFGESTDRTGRNIRKLLEKGDMRVLGIPLAALEYDRREPRVRVPTPDEVSVREVLGGGGRSGQDEREESERSDADRCHGFPLIGARP